MSRRRPTLCRIGFRGSPVPLAVLAAGVAGIVAFLFAGSSHLRAQDLEGAPSFEAVISLQRVGSVALSPDGRWILFSEYRGDPEALFFRNGELARVPAEGGEIEVLSADFDEDPFGAVWTRAGIRFGASHRTGRRLYALDPETREVRPLELPGPVVGSWDFSQDGATLAVEVSGPGSLGEVYRVEAVASADPGPAGTGAAARRPAGASASSAAAPGIAPRAATRLTDLTSQVEGWPVGTREVIRWESEDGTEIEGVLYRPEGYDPSRRYPLLVQIHGGPTGTSRPEMVPGYVYPILHWLAKGALVLQPNYRGSAGYEEAFRSLNVRNLGVGDMWT